MDKKPKIAVIGLKGLPAFGGAAAVGENIIEQLKEKYDFTVYSVSSHTHLTTGEYNGIKQIVFKKIKNKKLNTLLYYIKSSLFVIFSKNKVIHLHHRDAAFILPILKLFNKKIIVTLHGTRLVEKWKKYKLFFSFQDYFLIFFSDIITSVSPYIYSNKLLKSKRKIIYIPNGITFLNEKSLPSINYKNYLLFVAGRIVPSKGCHIFIKALKNLNYKKKTLIIGDLEQIPNYKKEIFNLSKGLDVKFLGLIKEKELLFSYMKNSELFIFPSNNEAMSMTLLEAASVKSRIICSDIPENKLIFSDEEISFFETDNIHALTNVISVSLNDLQTLDDKAERAYVKLIKNYNWEIIALRYNSLYEKLLTK